MSSAVWGSTQHCRVSTFYFSVVLYQSLFFFFFQFIKIYVFFFSCRLVYNIIFFKLYFFLSFFFSFSSVFCFFSSKYYTLEIYECNRLLCVIFQGQSWTRDCYEVFFIHESWMTFLSLYRMGGAETLTEEVEWVGEVGNAWEMEEWRGVRGKCMWYDSWKVCMCVWMCVSGGLGPKRETIAGRRWGEKCVS